MNKLIIILSLLFLPTLCFAQEYQFAESEEFGKYINILKDGKVIHTILPKHQRDILKEDWMGDETFVQPFYFWLAQRGSLESQPKAFDDILGDGISNFVCIERPDVLSNHPPWFVAIRTFSVSDTVEEIETRLLWIGEEVHYDDLDNDGALELVYYDGTR
ncbi:MAG: hypothetical protein PHY73_02045 [Candidatus Omnitrophica bacterium]|nr:hypothetical protein [Candidatus Omnitrophota bacterium]